MKTEHYYIAKIVFVLLSTKAVFAILLLRYHMLKTIQSPFIIHLIVSKCFFN